MNPHDTTRQSTAGSQAKAAAWKLVATYAVFSGLWILLSDKAVEALVADPATILLISIGKGWLFVGITSLLLFVLAHRLFRDIQAYSQNAREARTESQRTHQLLESIVESSSDAIFAKDCEGRYLLFNRAVARISGRDPESVLGRSDRDIFPEAQAGLIQEHDRDAIATGRVGTYEEVLSTAQGKRVFLATKGPLHDEAGQIIGIFGISRDITERKQAEEELRLSEANFRTLFENNTSVMLLIDQLSGAIVDANAVAEQFYGYPRERLLRMRISEINTLPPEQVAEERQRAANGERKTFNFPHRLASGEIREVEAHITPINRAGRRFLLSIIHDITQRRQAELLLRENEERLRLALSASNQGWFDADLRSGSVTVSPEYIRLLGYVPEEFHTDLENWLANVHPDERDAVFSALQACTESGGPCAMEYRRRTKSGEWRWIRSIGKVVQWDEKQRPKRMIGIHTDITERKEMEDQIRQLAFFDPLTRLPNRRLLNDRLSRAMATSKRSGRYCAVMFTDLDNFKPLNDMHGHEVGDLLLVEVANRLKNCVREMDTVARFGGDEFVVMICELDTDRAESVAQAGIVAEKVRIALARPYHLEVKQEGNTVTTVEHHCSASIGITLFVNHEATQGDVLKDADNAMYAAKEGGRNQVRFHRP